MKYTLLFAFVLAFFSTAHAQTTSLTAEDTWKDIKVGPLFSAGESVSAGTVANGAKTSSAFAFSAGAIADFPLNAHIAFTLGLAYDMRGINYHDQDNDANKVDYTFSYFEIRPEFRFSGFLLGVGIGIPVSATATAGGNILPPGGAIVSQSAPSVGSSSMDPLIEIRLGGEIPILQSSSGDLNLTIDGAYAFTQISKNPLTPYSITATPKSTENNGPLASVELGLQYLFDLTPH